MKIYFFKNLSKPIPLVVFIISLVSFKSDLLSSEYLSEDLQIDTSTKSEGDSSVIPTNPLEIMEMMRRYNSLNEATNPTDALDDALKSFNSLEEKKRNLIP